MGNHASMSKRVSGGMTLMLVLMLSMALMVPTQLAWADETQGGEVVGVLSSGDTVQIYDSGIKYEYNVNSSFSRVTVWFKLTKDVDLTFMEFPDGRSLEDLLVNPDADIVIDYFTVDEDGNLSESLAQKNKFWENFLLIYAEGEGWQSSPQQAPVPVPSLNLLLGGNNTLKAEREIATQSSSGSSIDEILIGTTPVAVASDTVFAATIRVTDAGLNSHAVTVYSDGRSASDDTVTHWNDDFKAGVEATTDALPAGVKMHLTPLEEGSEAYNTASTLLSEYEGFSAFDISFEYPQNYFNESVNSVLTDEFNLDPYSFPTVMAQPQAPVTLLLPMDGVNEGNSGQFEYTGLDIATGDTSAATFAAPNHGTFSASHFSGYALGWKPVGSNNPVIPATSDLLAPLGIVVLGLLICAGSVALFAGKRKHARSEQ